MTQLQNKQPYGRKKNM